MSTVLEQPGLPEARRARRWPWLALFAGLLALYVPTFISLASTLWRDDDYAHGPIILAVLVWLAWRGRIKGSDSIIRDGNQRMMESDPFILPGLILLALGLLLYMAGRAVGLPLFEVASLVPVAVAILLVMGGWGMVRRFAFPLLFLFFLIPLPGFILETISTPLKALVSAMVAAVLGVAGYPIEREGVVLFVGDHQMLLADACSGMNSLYSLTALTLLYTYLTGPSTRTRWAILLAAVAPIAILANVVRVLFLVLVAYHFGDEAAQGVLHAVAGMIVFVAAFGMLLVVDKAIGGKRVTRIERVVPAKAGTELDSRLRGNDKAVRGNDKAVRGNDKAAYLAAILMLGTALAVPHLKPVRAEGTAPDLQNLVPAAFGDWSIDNSVEPIAPTSDVQAKLDRIYTQTLSRTYVNAKGEQMMVTLAYGGDQSDALKAHRQEVCYTAQGFTVQSLRQGSLTAAGRTIPVTRMYAVRGDRFEPVTYWFTMGDRVVRSRTERLGVQLASAFNRRIPDGMLVRISSISSDPAQAFAAQQSFIDALLATMPQTAATRFVGAQPA